MPRRRAVGKLILTEVTPVLDPEERARRIEVFIDTMAKATDVKGYAGCKYFPEKECGEIYIAQARGKGAAS